MKKTLAILCAVLMTATMIAGCAKRGQQQEPEEPPASQAPKTPADMTEEEIAEHNAQLKEGDFTLLQYTTVKPGEEIAVLRTSEGEIRIRLFPEQAPKAVENFITLAEEGYYNGLTFHRVIEGFMIQSGDPNGTGTGGRSIYQDEKGNYIPFEDEFTTDLWHFRGALSMANPGIPDSNGSQFFIVQSPDIFQSDAESLRRLQYPESVAQYYEKDGGIPGLDWRHTVFGQVISGMEIVDQIASVNTDANDMPVEPVIIESLTIEAAQ